MEVRCRIDILGNLEGEPHLRVAAGQSFVIWGWIDSGDLRGNVYAIVDGAFRMRARTVKRLDLARSGRPEFVSAGFDATFSTEALLVGKHRLTVLFETGDHAQAVMFDGEFTVDPPADPFMMPRILVAAAPKSGSTYVHNVLRAYYNLVEAPLYAVDWQGNTDISEAVLVSLRARRYVLQLHIMPHFQNVQAILRERMSTVVTWRNLGDVVVSMDDHIRKEGGSGTLAFIDDQTFVAMPQQARYEFLIRYALPWYVSFYCSWKRVPEVVATWARYERLPEDPQRFFTEILHGIGEERVDAARLDAILGTEMDYSHARLNAGVNGRSAELFSDETKALLEAQLRAHSVPLDELIAELPWNAQKY